MIEKENFKEVLKSMGYVENGEVFYKQFSDYDTSLSVDFKEEKLIYPVDKGLKIEGDFITSFTQKENFVVFECVNRLLEKGYNPKHIILEPTWTVGHGASGGRGDIMIKDNTSKSLLIIECKTAGKEFEIEWKKTLVNGGQLFTYAKQAGSTQFVCLYTADFIDNKVHYSNYIITLNDNDQLLDDLKEKSPISYKEAKLLDKEDIYLAWVQTYSQDYTTKGIFETDIRAYEIGKNKYSLSDLNVISSRDIQGKYHEFATILRQHNVSGRENAFDKLVNLFLCKIVDETNNPEELKFYWKGSANDSFFELQDRLQKLYQEGMKKFLSEDVTYIDNEAIDGAFKFFKSDPDATKETIKKFFRELKFFTNNDFSFMDVHNEKLFFQNSMVLLKMVQMLQDIQLKTNQQNQFLGDMFEGFLDQGVKQSEGQFFTPMPIVKFILNSLPLEDIVTQSENIPKVIDYACGAGHFLNEYAQQIKPFIETNQDVNISEYYEEIYGIEKEYRLSKVAKVSAFMYAQDDINVIYADALASNPLLKNQDFSILIANPPYSVKGFLETLSDVDRNKFELIQCVEEKNYSSNNSIEAFFIERAKQLLKPGGVAGIIVPTSLLTKGAAKNTSKTKNIYVKSREILLKYFDIIAISEFGSGTFGKTGTNTITLFLRRKTENPSQAEHYFNRVNSWFNGDTSKDGTYEDENLIKKYCDQIEIPYEEYISLLFGQPNSFLLDKGIFKDYKKAFDKWNEIKNRKKQKTFKALSEQEKEIEMFRKFTKYTQEIEKEKLYYFMLSYLNPQNVLVIKSPNTTTKMKEFLGYEWSSTKGSEGIKYLGGQDLELPSEHNPAEGNIEIEEDEMRVIENIFNLNNIHTPLYDPNDIYNELKINSLISKNFKQESFEIPEELSEYVLATPLVNLLDFSKVDFNKAISTNPNQKITVPSQWEVMKIGEIEGIEVRKGTTITKLETRNGNIPVVAGGRSYAYLHDTPNREGYTITISASGASAGYVNLWSQPIFASDCTTINSSNETFIIYLYNLLKFIQDEVFSLGRGAAQPHVYPDDIRAIKVPIPPQDIQEKVVQECKVLDKHYKDALNKIFVFEEKIKDYLHEVYQSDYPKLKIEQFSANPQYGINEKMNTRGIGHKIFRMNEIINGYMVDNGGMKYVNISNEEFQEYKLEKGDILFNRTNSIELVGKTGIYELEGEHCFASYLIRLKVDKNLVTPKYVNYMMNSNEFQSEAKQKATRSINQANINANKMKEISIPVPNDKEEQLRIITKLEAFEEEIRAAREIVNNFESKIKEVFNRYL